MIGHRPQCPVVIQVEHLTPDVNDLPPDLLRLDVVAPMHLQLGELDHGQSSLGGSAQNTPHSIDTLANIGLGPVELTMPHQVEPESVHPVERHLVVVAEQPSVRLER